VVDVGFFGGTLPALGCMPLGCDVGGLDDGKLIAFKDIGASPRFGIWGSFRLFQIPAPSRSVSVSTRLTLSSRAIDLLCPDRSPVQSIANPSVESAVAWPSLTNRPGHIRRSGCRSRQWRVQSMLSECGRPKDFAADYRERAVGGQPRATLPSFRSEVCNLEQTVRAAPAEDAHPQTPHKSVMKRNTMTALNAWAVALCCPHCGRTGTVTVSESSLDRPAKLRVSVDTLSMGFVAVELRSGVGQDIRCATCNSSALK